MPSVWSLRRAAASFWASAQEFFCTMVVAAETQHCACRREKDLATLKQACRRSFVGALPRRGSTTLWGYSRCLASLDFAATWRLMFNCDNSQIKLVTVHVNSIVTERYWLRLMALPDNSRRAPGAQHFELKRTACAEPPALRLKSCFAGCCSVVLHWAAALWRPLGKVSALPSPDPPPQWCLLAWRPPGAGGGRCRFHATMVLVPPPHGIFDLSRLFFFALIKAAFSHRVVLSWMELLLR